MEEKTEGGGAGVQDWETLVPIYVKQVRSVLEESYGLIIPNHSDEFLVRCLRLKDGNVNKAVKLIKAFHGVTGDFQSWDVTLQPTLYLEFYENGPVVGLAKRDAFGRRIYIIRPGLWNLQKTKFDELVACIWMMAQYINAEFEDVQRLGFVTIWDFQDFSFQHAWAVKQRRLLNIANMIQDSVVGRMKSIHLINHPSIVNTLYLAVKHFFKEKLRKRLMFHESNESLFEHLDQKLLPPYLGGTTRPEECIDGHFVKDFLNTDQYFKEMMKHGLPSK